MNNFVAVRLCGNCHWFAMLKEELIVGGQPKQLWICLAKSSLINPYILQVEPHNDARICPDWEEQIRVEVTEPIRITQTPPQRRTLGPKPTLTEAEVKALGGLDFGNNKVRKRRKR